MDSDDDISRANRAKRGSPYLNTDQAAAYLKFSSRLLKRLRRAGKGPIFRRHSRFVQYHIDALDAWSRAQSMGATGHEIGRASCRARVCKSGYSSGAAAS